MVALTIIGGVLVAMAFVLTGALGAYGAARQRSGVVEVGNGIMESLRAVEYDQVGVLSSDADRAAAYPGGQHDGRDAVVLTSGASPPTPPAVEVISTAPAEGVPVPLTVRRWVTWTNADGGNGVNQELKRLDVELVWKENSRVDRSVTLTSLLYPGGQGPAPTVPSGNGDPVADFTLSPSAPSAGTPVTFTSASTDPDGDPLTFLWGFPDGSTSTTDPAVFTFTSPGSHTVILEVSDGNGGVDLVSKVIAVTASSSPPVAAFTVSAPPGRPDVVTVDASATTDPDLPGDTLSYSWDFGDGSPATTGATATHRYLATGSVTITLTVTDASGNTSTANEPHNVSVVGCTIIRASFKNPVGNATSNEIDVFNNGANAGKPRDLPVMFTATTTLACNTLSAQLPKTSGTFDVNLVGSVSGPQKNWTVTTSFTAADKFGLGTSQTGYFRSPETTGADHTLPISFSVV